MECEKIQFTVLYVEDEEAIRENYLRYLKKYFINVYEAQDGEKAYEVYKEKKPELLIVDINLPKMNGLELIKKIRETDRTTRIIVLTAYSDVHYLLDATELMLTKYLIKPIMRLELKNALNIAVRDLLEFTISSNSLFILREGFSYNLETNELFKNQKNIPLTNMEIKLLSLMLRSPKRIFSYANIIYELWDMYEERKISSIKTLIKKLRQKLPQDTIQNVFGVGYKINI